MNGMLHRTIALLLALAAAGCGPSIPKDIAELPLDRPPPSPELPPVRFPEARDATLQSGLEVVVLPMRTTPTVSIELEMPGGERLDPLDRTGLASFTAEALKLGTATRNAAQIAERIDSLGAAVSFSCDADSCSANIQTLSKDLDETLALVADLLIAPTFPQDEIDNLRGQMLTWLAYQESQPEFPGMRLLHALLFPAHAYGRYAPTEASLTAITREDVVRFHRRHFTPRRAILVAAGDVDAAELVDTVKLVLGTWRPAAEAAPELAPPGPVKPERAIHLVDRPGAVQATILVGHRGPARPDKGYVAARVADEILGGGAARRLFRDLRERRGLTYGAGTDLDARLQGGLSIAIADVRTEKVGEALTALLQQIAGMRAAAPPEDELREATRYLAGALALRLDSPAQVAALTARQRLLGLPEDEWTSWSVRLAAVRPQDVQDAAETLWSQDGLVVVVVGDAEGLAPQLAPLMTVVRYDAAGNVQTTP